MQHLSTATRSNRRPEECADSALMLLEHFNGGPGEWLGARFLASDLFGLAEAITNVRAALIADPAQFADLPEVAWSVRQSRQVFRESYSALLPAHVVTRGFAALEGLLAVKVKPEKKGDRMRWHRLMQEAHYFQNALHNYAIGFELGLPTGAT